MKNHVLESTGVREAAADASSRTPRMLKRAATDDRFSGGSWTTRLSTGTAPSPSGTISTVRAAV
jgi:hypothetical protein